jgi:hypothetical protein
LGYHRSGGYQQGRFEPINPGKYIGATPVLYLSSWEYRLFIRLDQNPNVLKWSANTVKIPYVFQGDNRNHSYFMDAYVEMGDGKGGVRKILIEIKPDKQCYRPDPPKNNNTKALKNYREKCLDYVKNQNKWNTAWRFARANSMIFYVLTEKGSYTFIDGIFTRVSNKGINF